MKLITCLLVSACFGTAFGQYTGPTNSSVIADHYREDLTGWYYGPTSGWYPFTLISTSACTQLSGSASEPISWSLLFQNLYSNSWNTSKTIYVMAADVRFKIYTYHDTHSYTQQWVRNSDSAVFKRLNMTKEYNYDLYAEVEDL